jgi:DNA-binding LacI/PurR family transcriptional regulator
MRSHDLEPIIVAGGFTEAGGVSAARALLDLDPLPTAVFASNDISAMGVMQTLESAGLRIPDDVSLVGYDNVDFAGLGHISLTTVDQPRRQIGTIAVDLLLDRIEGTRERRRRVTVDPSLIVRDTTGPPRGHRIP